MELSCFARLKRDVASKATTAQILELEDVVRVVVTRQFAEVALACRISAVATMRACPRCSSHDVVLHGAHKNGAHKNGRQRFKCRGCRRTYNGLTGIGVDHVTAWRWRHRFLKAAIKDNAAVLSSVIEADETFFLRSFRGHRNWKRGLPPENRAARPSAWGALKRGVSSEQVPVLTAFDNAGGVFGQVLSGMSGIEAALSGRIAPGSVLCSDGAQAYLRAAKAAGAEHRGTVRNSVCGGRFTH